MSAEIPVNIVSTQQNKPIGEEDKKKRKRLKHSNFFLTINLNKQFKTYDEAVPLANEFKKVIDNCLAKISNYIEINDTVHPDAKLDSKWIKKINIQSVVEIGSKYNQPHAHVTIAITHWTRVKLNWTKLKEDIREKVGDDQEIYLYCKLFRDSQGSLEEYLRKGIH